VKTFISPRTKWNSYTKIFIIIYTKQFTFLVNALDAKIPALARHQIIVEMAGSWRRSATDIPTSHRRVIRRSASNADRFVLLQDGLFIRAAQASQSKLLGERVVRIGNVDVWKAYAAVKTLISRDNEQGSLYWAPQYLVMPEVLHARSRRRHGIGSAGLANGQTVVLHPLGPAEMMPRHRHNLEPRTGWLDARGKAIRCGFGRKGRVAHAGSAGNEDAVRAAQSDQRSVAEVRRGDAAEDRGGGIDRLILDLRLNRGGHGD
jgi:hypothetical protein